MICIVPYNNDKYEGIIGDYTDTIEYKRWVDVNIAEGYIFVNPPKGYRLDHFELYGDNQLKL
jgi:hypothetical protein